MTNRQGYTNRCTRVYRVYKGVQGVLEFAGYTRVYRVYKSIPGMQEYTGCRDPGNGVVQGIWGIK